MGGLRGFTGGRKKSRVLYQDLFCSLEMGIEYDKSSRKINWYKDEDEIRGLYCKEMRESEDFQLAYPLPQLT